MFVRPLAYTRKMFNLGLKRNPFIFQSKCAIRGVTIRAKHTEVSTNADVVIIGGGSAGCYTLYQLAKRGIRTVLLERHRITSGTTWHTNGLMWRIRANDVDTQLLNRGRDIVRDIQDNTEYNPGWIENGGLFIARTQERLNEYAQLESMAKAFNITHSMLSADETIELFPLLNRNAVVGALYSPGDGMVDPSMLCNALLKLAKQTGCAEVVENCSVQRILATTNDRGKRVVCGVDTSSGTIKSNCIVNATGVWGGDLLAPFGISLPVIPMKHSYIVTDAIDGMSGMPNVRDHDASIVFRVQGSALYLGGYEKNPEILDTVRDDFAFELYDFDWSTYEAHIQRAEEICPAFATVGIKTTICGPESFTPDHKPIMGPDPRALGLFHNCGYNSAGMMFGGGCAEQLANWIVCGQPEFHMHSYDVRRFSLDQLSNVTWARERSHEAYAENYSIAFKYAQPLAGRNAKLDALHADMIANGAVMEECQGFERPSFFCEKNAPVQPYDWHGSYGHTLNGSNAYATMLQGDMKYGISEHHRRIASEVVHSHTTATICNLSANCKLHIRGPDARKAMHWICVGDLDRPRNSVIRTYTLNQVGGVEGDLTVCILQCGHGDLIDPICKNHDEYFATSDGKYSHHTLCHINELISKLGYVAIVDDLTDQIGVLLIQGPYSHQIIERAFELCPTDVLPDTATVSVCHDIKVRIIAGETLGPAAYELHVAMSDCPTLYNKLLHIGSEYGLQNAGHRAIRSMHFEKGIYQWGYDLQSSNTAIESNLGAFCRRNGLYSGSNVVDQQREIGVTKQLVSFTIDEQTPIWGSECVYRDGEIVGYVRSADYGHMIKKSIGTVFVRRHDGHSIDNEYLLNGAYEIELLNRKYPIQLRL